MGVIVCTMNKNTEIKLHKWGGTLTFKYAITSGTRYCKRRDSWGAGSLE